MSLSGTVDGFTLQMTKMVHIDYPDVGTISETPGLLILDPLLYANAATYGFQAQEYGQSLIAEGMSHNDANAIQHAYRNALIASDLAWTTADALLATTAHEFSNKANGGHAYDTVADLHNNFVGAFVIHASADQIKADLLVKLASGELWRVDAFESQIEKSNGKPIYDL